MTSTSSASSRPLYTHDLVTGLPRHRMQDPVVASSRTSLKREEVVTEDDNLEFPDDRPVKRRKVSTVSIPSTRIDPATDAHPRNDGNQVNITYTAASWLNIIAAHNDESRGGQQRQKESSPMQPLPLPDRPWTSTQLRPIVPDNGRSASRVRKNTAVPCTPDSIVVPTDAPLFEDQRRADYFPWTGKHPEDVLNEQTVKAGYYDRPPNPAEKELNTAKTSVYNALKHRAGLESLSAVFALVLSQKNQQGAYTALSTFKGPPPRVTLTETKRKSWIADLANPEVPLRRLSKTIPQGIRGQFLLEQCLQHSVPLSRAIWFTKCVGANEIRTLKRKGLSPSLAHGAEAKWLREWTLNIEQFVDQVLGQCGQNKWKERIRYAIQLATRLYAANLMDRDHYLDWIVKSFSAANMSHWPFWLMIVNLHGPDLVAYRKRGKQTAEMLVTKYSIIKSQPEAIVEPLARRMAHTLRAFALLKPACFIMPDRWSECSNVLRACLATEVPREETLFNYLEHANTRLSGIDPTNHDGQQTSLERVIEILDAAKAPIQFASLVASLEAIGSDQALLMNSCVKWCTSRFQAGLTRVYTVARLFRRWHRKNWDVDAVLLDFIATSMATPLDIPAYKHLFSELSRSNTFAVSKYLQWLVVRGCLPTDSFHPSAVPLLTDAVGPPVVLDVCTDTLQLLTDLCLVNQSQHVRNMRHAVLKRAGYDSENEAAALRQLQKYLTGQMSGPRTDTTTVVYAQLPWSLRTQLSHWLRVQTIEMVRLYQNESMKPPTFQHDSNYYSRFAVIRGVLEQLQDIAVLADVLRISAVIKQEGILATIVDTINLHAAPLSAIGALEPLQQFLGSAYTSLSPVKTTMPFLATSLIELCQEYPVKGASLRALQRDFVLGDQSRANAACSPFSDGVAESLQQAGENFHDDFEAILQTESNMNEQTMIRLFNLLVARIEKLYGGDAQDPRVFGLCQLLCRLKSCRNTHGDVLLRKWLVRILTSPRSAQADNSALLNQLIASRCVHLETLLDVCQQLSAGDGCKRRLQDFIRGVVALRKTGECESQLDYTVRLAGSKLVRNKPAGVLEILVVGNDFRGSQDIDAAMVASILAMPDTVKTLSRPAGTVLAQKLAEILGDTQPSASVIDQVKSLARAAGPLSMPFCQFRLRMLCQSAAVKSDERLQDDIAMVLYSAIDDGALQLHDSPLSIEAILRAVGPAIGVKIRSKVEQAFFQALPKFLQGKTPTHHPLPSHDDTEQLRRVLTRVAAVNTDGSSAHTNSAALLVEKLSMYLKCLGPSTLAAISNSRMDASTPNKVTTPVIQSPTTTTSTAPSLTPSGTVLRGFMTASLETLSILMQMICTVWPSRISPQLQPSPTTAKQTQSDQIKLVSFIVTIATHPAWLNLLDSTLSPPTHDDVRDTINFMLDVAATLVDEMADEGRAICARLMKEKVRVDERAKWLVGSVGSMGSMQCSDIWGVSAGFGSPTAVAMAAGNTPATGSGLQMWSETKGSTVGEFRPKVWELLESGGGGGGPDKLAASNDGCLGLGLFAARRQDHYSA